MNIAARSVCVGTVTDGNSSELVSASAGGVNYGGAVWVRGFLSRLSLSRAALNKKGAQWRQLTKQF